MIVRKAGRTAAYAYVDEISNILWRDKLMDDNIKSPKHYKLGDLNIEAIDVIRAVLGDTFPEYCRGNVLKYLIRAGKKDDMMQDLKKARVYLDWEIEAREKIMKEDK